MHKQTKLFSNQEKSDVTPIHELQKRYLELVNKDLPERAKQYNCEANSMAGTAVRYPVYLNHCFGRVLLDALFNDCWYHHLDQSKTAYKQLSSAQLEQAINLGEAMLSSPSLVQSLNQKSLTYRGKG